jgi:hypothetical protein
MIPGIIGLCIWAAAARMFLKRARTPWEQSDKRFRAVVLFIIGIYFVGGFWS